MAPASVSTATPLAELQAATAHTARRAPRRDPVLIRHYTHSGLAIVLDVVARVLVILAIVVQLYIFSQIDWDVVSEMPLDLALTALGTSVLPGGILGLLALLTMSTAHILEYLARMARCN